MDNPMLKQLCPLDTASETMLEEAVLKYELSARSYFRTIKLARTIADLAGDEKIEVGHVAEALQLRIRN
jgi:magnesium chelatase family protein